MERGTVEWNSGMVERWNSGMGNYDYRKSSNYSATWHWGKL